MSIREDYQALTEKQLNAWKVQSEQFKTGAAQMEAHAKVQYEQALALLHTKQEEAWDNFHKMKNASETAWGQLKANMDKAGAELKDAAERMTTQFKK
jgi:hypothetical protein